MTRVLAFGTFDVFHPGHEYFLKQAKSYGDELVVVVARDSTVRALKKKEPLHDESSRLKVISELFYVDDAFLGHVDDKYKVIEELRPDVICLGFDQESYTSGLEDKIKEFGLETRIVRIGAYKPEKYKSSRIKERFEKED
jgi:FAD synthetase